MTTIISDVHGKYDKYKEIVSKCKYSVQIGDMGFNYEPLKPIDPSRHKFFGGNHDNYDYYDLIPHSLGDFGAFELGGVKFFFVRGAFSIDVKYRTPSVDWWEREELTTAKLIKCIELYQYIKPDLVLSHDAPQAIIDIIGNPNVLVGFGFNPETFKTRTQTALQFMIEMHQPKKWVFGHHHKSVVVKYNNCEFQCLNELEILEIT